MKKKTNDTDDSAGAITRCLREDLTNFEAQERLARLVYGRVLTIARSMLRRHSRPPQVDTELVAHNVIHKLIPDRLDDVTNSQRFFALASKVAHDELVSCLRREGCRPHEQINEAHGDELTSVLRSPEPSDLLDLDTVMSRLHADHEEEFVVLVMHYYLKFSLKDVSQILGDSYHAIRWRRTSGLERLEKWMLGD